MRSFSPGCPNRDTQPLIPTSNNIRTIRQRNFFHGLDGRHTYIWLPYEFDNALQDDESDRRTLENEFRGRPTKPLS